MNIADSLRTALLRVLRQALAVGDSQVERALGAPYALRLLSGALARSYDPSVVPGFGGTIAVELRRPASGGDPLLVLLEVRENRASARPVPEFPASVTLRLSLPLADFARIATGAIDPAEPLLDGRAHAEGDLAVVARLAEMFGAPHRR